MAGLGKYSMAGYDRIGVYSVKPSYIPAVCRVCLTCPVCVGRGVTGCGHAAVTQEACGSST